MYIHLTSLSRGLFTRTIRYSLNMLRDINDYVVAQDITNHLQVGYGDAVTISAAAFKQLKRVNSTLRWSAELPLHSPVLLPASSVRCRRFRDWTRLTAAEIAAVGGAIGGTASAIGAHAYAITCLVTSCWKLCPSWAKFSARILSSSELYHVEVEWYIPSPDGGYTTQVHGSMLTIW